MYFLNEKYWQGKGKIIGRCVEMWDTFDQILDEGVARNPDIDENFSHTDLENRLYKKFLLLIEVAPAMIKALRKGKDAVALDRVVDRGRKDARRVDVNGVRGAIGQWPCIKWEPAFPTSRHLLGFNHDVSGQLLCPVTLNWNDLTVREGLRRGTQHITAADLPTFLWPSGVFDIEDLHKAFLRGPLLVTTYKHIFISPSSAKETDRSMRGGNAALHDITFVTYESIAYVATVTRFALSDEPSFSPGGSNADQRHRGGFPYRIFYRELLEHKELMSEDEVISLIQWWNEKIFPRTIYTTNVVNMDSAGAIMREQAEAKRITREAAEEASSTPSLGVSEEI